MKRNPIETAAGETFGGEPEPVYARPFRARTIIFAALAGLVPAVLLIAFIFAAL